MFTKNESHVLGFFVRFILYTGCFSAFKENYDSLLGEYQTLQRTLQAKDSDRNEVFDYIKTLVNDMLLGQTPQEPENVHDKSMQATLTNLCNTSTDYVQSHNDLKQRLANSQIKVRSFDLHFY